MSSFYVDRDDVRIYASATAPASDLPWIVFSNSLMTDHTIWDAQIDHFGQRFNTLRYDQRGHGRSSVQGRVHFDDLSGDVLALLDHFQIERCIYVGLSMGVPTGLSLVGRAPERVSHMVLSDGQLATQATGRQTWQSRIDAARANGMAWVAEDTVERWFAPESRSKQAVQHLQAAAAAMDVEGYCACAGALQDYDFTTTAAGLSIPVQLLAGENDGAMPKTMQTMADTIPHANLNIIAHAGHIPNVEQADRFNAALDTFLTSHKL